MRSPNLLETSDSPQQAAREAELLLEINLQLTRTRSLDDLLQMIIERAAEVLNCGAASILLFDEGTETLRFVAASGSNLKELAEIPVPLEGSIAGKIFTEERSLIVDDVTKEKEHFDEVSDEVGFSPQSLLGVPLRIGGEPIGVLEVLNKQSGSLTESQTDNSASSNPKFTENDVSLLSVIAAQAAVAIRNARQVEALEDANEQLSRLDELKNDFMALASHELRTPLSVLLGFADILEEEAGPDLRSHVDSILEAAGKMKRVIDSMTQMVMLRSGETDLEREAVVFQNILRRAQTKALREITSSDDPSTEDPSMEVAFGDETLEGDPSESVRSGGEQCPPITLKVPEHPVRARVDPERIQRVLENLLVNAVRFTPPDGEITIELFSTEEEVQIEIHDTGVGLSEEEQERAFEEFYQAEDTLTRSKEGLGMGLTIAKKLIELHDGQIWLESDGVGEGTSVVIHLPKR